METFTLTDLDTSGVDKDDGEKEVEREGSGYFRHLLMG